MISRLEELIIWFLELGQLYIIVYGLVGGLVLVGIFLAWANDQDWSKHVIGLIPFMFLPMILKQSISMMNMPPEAAPLMNVIMANIDFVYVLPVIFAFLIVIKGVFQG